MDYYSLRFAFFVVIVILLFPIFARRRASWVAVMIVALAIVPNSSIFSEERVVGGGFKLFFRYIGGVLCLWDVLILVAFFLILSSGKLMRTVDPLTQNNRKLYVIGCIWAFGALIGIAHATVFKYGYTSIANVIQQVLPSIYFFVSILLSRTLLQTEKDVEHVLNIFTICSVAILIEGAAFLFLALAELIPVLRGYGGIPIVVYDGMAFLTFSVLLTCAKYCFGQRISFIDKLLFLGGVFFILISTRRSNLFFLVLNLSVIYLFSRQRIFSLRTVLSGLKAVGLIVAPLLVVLYLFVPDYFGTFGFILSSFDISSEAGEQSAGTLRMAQLGNMFLNMNTEAPLSYFWGMGFGTQWFEYIPLVGLNSEGDGAYIGSVQELGELGWWPYFHLSSVSMLYRFGFAGTILVFVVSFMWLKGWSKALRGFTARHRPWMFVTVLLGFEYLIVVGDSVDSAWPALIGILFGALETASRIARVTESHKTGPIEISAGKSSNA
jgi:hypothetical protein